MTRRSHGRPALPPDAKDEILHVLFANMEISGDEIAAILKNTMSPATPTSCRTATAGSWASASWPASGMPLVSARSCPMGRGGMLCWSAAGIANSSRPSAAAFKIRRMA